MGAEPGIRKMASSGFSSSLSNDDVGQRKLGNFGPFRFTRSTTERRVSKRVKFVFKLIPPPPLAKELANLILEVFISLQHQLLSDSLI